MKARQFIGGAALSPDVLRVLFEAFDDAWSQVAPEVSTRPDAIEAARLSLATIVFSLAKVHPLDPDSVKTAAIEAFRFKHRLP